ncbi:MAG: hypothetical protein KIS86_13480 [Devosia sp.]|nr:hypothetical protein [Devosia sp.]
MRDMIATKPLVYNSRRMLPGQHFTVKTDRHARLYAALGKARSAGLIDAPPAPVARKIATPPKSPASGNEASALDKLRADYFEVVKKKPYHGWDAAELQRRIDETLAS